MKGLLQSRKFWIAVVDLFVSNITYFVSKYVAPGMGNDILWLIGSWQPVIIALITGIAIEDAGTNANPTTTFATVATPPPTPTL
jgi:hypothetical protein